MEYRLLALDLDGTLLTDDKRITERAVSALRAAIDGGAEVIFCTGRRYRSVIPMAEQIDRAILVACNNGAAVRAFPGHSVVLKNLFPKRHFGSVAALLVQRDLSPVLHIDMFDEGIDLCCARGDSNRFHRAYVSRNSEFLSELEDLRTAPADKVIQFIVMGQLSRLEQALEAVHSSVSDGELNLHIVRNLTIPACALEILHGNAEKWQAVLTIAARKGIDREQIVAVGDDISDLTLIQNAGFGVAVDNALPEVKLAASLVVPNNNEDGAAIAIERLFL